MLVEDYLRRLQNPNDKARPYTRWWWYGAAVEEEEIRRELLHMKEAGLGGVELQVLYPLEPDDAQRGIKNHPYASPQFFAMVQCAVDECEALGLEFDMTLGSSWPYGGPFIPQDMAPEILIPYQWDIEGPVKFSQDFTGLWAGTVVNASIVRMRGAQMEPETLRDVTGELEETWIYSWPYGYRFRDLNVPEGVWKLTIMVAAKYRQQVGAPARDMAGNVIDHCRSDVTAFFLKNAGDPLVERLGTGRVRSFFCDSIELEGNNWTANFLTEFRSRRGYDIQPYLPALWGSMGAITPHVRFDYHRTMSELTIANFFVPLTQWSHRQGSMARIQAHGTWADILQVYAAGDIPEGETFGEGDALMVNTVHRRLASSAGNVYGRNIISNESFTWLRMPRFLVDLEMIKLAADAIFLDGINHIINHGYAYSPPHAGRPGHAFYASSLISHTNTWWEYYPELAAYMQRVSSLLQEGRSVADVGIYIPQNDIWADTPMGELHMSMKIEDHIGTDMIAGISRAGYWFNFLNDDVIQKAAVTSDGLVINHNNYQVLVLPNCQWLPLATAETLLRWVKSGGTLIALGKMPCLVPGALEREEQQTRLDQITTELFGTGGAWHAVGHGRTVVSTDYCPDNAVKYLREALPPDLQLMQHNDCIGYVHRVTELEDIYFVANVSRETKDTVMRFRQRDDRCLILDPLTQRITAPDRVRVHADGVDVHISFPPGTSFFVIFAPQLPRLQPAIPAQDVLQHSLDLSRHWTLHIPEIQLERGLDTITTWENIQECRYYCGSGIYKKEFELQQEQVTQNAVLSLDTVAVVADVRVNGHNVGVLWKCPYDVEIGQYLRVGSNVVEIHAVNLWYNRFLDPDLAEPVLNDTVIAQWPYFSATINQVRGRRLYGWRERALNQGLQPSGVGGPVTLSFYGAPARS